MSHVEKHNVNIGYHPSYTPRNTQMSHVEKQNFNDGSRNIMLVPAKGDGL